MHVKKKYLSAIQYAIDITTDSKLLLTLREMQTKMILTYNSKRKYYIKIKSNKNTQK